MAEKPADTKSSEHKSPEPKSPEPKSFAQFLEEAPAPAETVTMVGSVARSTRKGLFVLTSGGQMLELPIDAVTSYRVVSEGPQQLVELQVVTSKIDSNRIFKAAFADPGAQPFVLATPHHAPPEALLTQMPGGAAAQLTTVITDIVTSVYSDRPNTSVYADPGGGTSVYADPGGGTSVYADPGGTSVYADPPHTSVYADRPHTIKEMAKDPIQDTIFNPGVPVEQFDAAAQEAQAEAAAVLKPAFAEGVGTSVYADAGNTSVYADPPQTSVYADLRHTSVYADQPHTSVYADQHTSVYADQPHTIKEMAKDPIQDAIFNPGVPVEQFAEAAPGAQAEAAAALKPVFAEGVGTSVYADAGNTSVYADQPRTSVYADQPQTSVYADPGGGTSVYADPGGGTSVYADPGGTSVYADPHTGVYADQPHTRKELVKDPIVDSLVANPVWNLPGMMF